MSEENKPRLQLLERASLYRFEVCSPIKEKINQIEVCAPNLVVTPCSPIERVKCLPDIWCSPKLQCLPTETCLPMIYPCLPVIGPCSPQYGPCGPMVEMPFQRIDEISEKVERLTAEIEALRKRLAK